MAAPVTIFLTTARLWSAVHSLALPFYIATSFRKPMAKKYLAET
jgi:hypothetical protein